MEYHMIQLNEIKQLSVRPELYEKGTAVMWTDTHISKQLLNIHLNPELDLASRKKESIESTVQWILEGTDSQTLDILDLGCGPGLYTQRFAQKGHKVTGVDFSEHSIAYARKIAEEKNLNICYRKQNYLKLEDKEKFDLAVMIFTDFGVLNPDERIVLLANVERALKPGGVFIFDVLSDNQYKDCQAPNHWETAQHGFWRNEPYLLLSNSFLYETEKIILYQHGVIEEKSFKVYRFWTHYFSTSDLKQLLLKTNFGKPVFDHDVIGADETNDVKPVTFCKVVKQ